MVLRPATPADLDPLIALAQRPDVARTLAWDAADGLAAALAADTGELLVIEDAGALAGAVRWTVTNRRSRIAEIRTLMLDPATQGRGLAAASVLELVERLFGRHGMHRIEAEVMGINATFGPDVTLLLSSDWKDPRIRPVLGRMVSLARLTAKGYLDSLAWLPEGLKEIIAIHTLNAGSSPQRTPALYAAMPAVMATEGVWVPEGGPYELVVALARLAEASGAEIRTEEPVERVEEGRIFAHESVYEPDVIVADLDANRLENLLTPAKPSVPKRLTPSGVAMYGVLKEPLPPEVPNRNTVLPADTDAFFASLESGEEPEQTVVFLNHYRPGEVYPNEKGTLTLQLAVPASGRSYDLDDPRWWRGRCAG